MNQAEECATKRVFGVIISYDNVVCKCLLDLLAGLTVFSLVTGLYDILTNVLLLELTVFTYRFQVYCTSMGLS